jgi:ABC-type uncharacterized transport system ATPase subunit
VVLTTHSFGGGLAVADRVVILAGGRVVLDRAAADLPIDELHRAYDDIVEGAAAP